MNFLKSISIALGTSTLISSITYLLTKLDWLSMVIFFITFGVTAFISQRTLNVKSAQQQNIGLRDIAFTTNKINDLKYIQQKFINIKRQRLSKEQSEIVYNIITICDNIFNIIEQNPLLYYGNELFFLEELPMANSLIDKLLVSHDIIQYETAVQQILTLLQQRQQNVLNHSNLDEQTTLSMLAERTKNNEQQVQQQLKIKQH